MDLDLEKSKMRKLSGSTLYSSQSFDISRLYIFRFHLLRRVNFLIILINFSFHFWFSFRGCSAVSRWSSTHVLWAAGAPMGRVPRGGGDLYATLPRCVCRKVVLFRLQVSEMSDMISLKMGVKFATSLNMGGKIPQKPYIIHVKMYYLV